MSAFAAAIDVIFADPNMAAAAEWRPACGGPGVPCRVILRRPDAISDYGAARIGSPTVLLDVRVAQIAAPRSGDRFIVGPVTYQVQGDPMLDSERLVWRCEAPEA